MLATVTRKIKTLIMISSLTFICCAGLGHYWQYLFDFYPEHAVTAFMGTTEHLSIAKRHSEYDWYIQVAIPPGLGDTLLRRHSFHTGYDPDITKGKIPVSEINACKGCWSYYEDKGHGIYGYLLAVLSPDKKELRLYELFGN
jgi:hypothetical protein